MSRILPATGDNQPERNQPCDANFINGTCYTNSAAKFWYGLAAEVYEDYPDCTDIELSTTTDDWLTTDILFPEIALGRDLERLLLADIETERGNTIAELEIIGPPPPVHISLLSSGTEIMSTDLSLDIIDSGIFSCLVAWLLQWSNIPASEWNSDRLQNCISIEDRKRGVICRLSFLITKQHLSEGIFRKSIRISHSVRIQS